MSTDVNEKHGRAAKYKMENVTIRHPSPTFNVTYWVLPMDAFPSIRKRWYEEGGPEFQATVMYRICFHQNPHQF